MRACVFFTALWVCLAGLASGATADQPAAPLRVISYNVQFLPSLAAMVNKRGDPRYRAKELGKVLAVYDIVGLNEVFDDRPRELLLEGLKQAWGDSFAAVVHPKPGDGRFNGGLTIATRLPVLGSHTTIYTQASSPKKYGLGADGYAAKGVVHARIARGPDQKDQFVDVFITHMEAREDAIRPSQYKELAAFMKEHAAGTQPILVMGDFNTHGNPADQDDKESPYNVLLGDMRAAIPDDELLDLWPTLHGRELGGTNEQDTTERGNRIDYIFLANPKGPMQLLKPLTVRVNPFPDKKVEYLSDHSAVEADLEWTAK